MVQLILAVAVAEVAMFMEVLVQEAQEAQE
jgi:hypothetical protein